VSWANKRFNPSTIVGKAPNAARANESDRIQVMRDEFFRRMDAKDAEIKALRAQRDELVAALAKICGEGYVPTPIIVNTGPKPDAVDLDHLPENNYA
jgi:hypothetical protein